MSLSQPNPPDPTQLAQTQAGYNTGAAASQQGINEINQVTPFGSLTYSGTPGFGNTATQSLSPQLQALLDQYQKTQGTIGKQASTLAGNLSSSGAYDKAPDFTSASAPLVKSQMDAFNAYMAPTYRNQESNINSELASQGISQGSDAWNNAKRSFLTSQDQATQSALMNFEPQAYSQAVQSYMTPLQVLQGMFGASSPQGTTQNFVNTPTATIQPANYMGAAEKNYEQQNQIYADTMSGLFGLGDAAIGAVGTAVGGKTSDRRVKTDIEEVGRLFNGLPVYRFRYLGDPTVQIGLMAQDVELVRPEAVVEIEGVKHVYYDAAVRMGG